MMNEPRPMAAQIQRGTQRYCVIIEDTERDVFLIQFEDVVEGRRVMQAVRDYIANRKD